VSVPGFHSRVDVQRRERIARNRVESRVVGFKRLKSQDVAVVRSGIVGRRSAVSLRLVLDGQQCGCRVVEIFSRRLSPHASTAAALVLVLLHHLRIGGLRGVHGAVWVA
jgi:hypothetical protein